MSGTRTQVWVLGGGGALLLGLAVGALAFWPEQGGAFPWVPVLSGAVIGLSLGLLSWAAWSWRSLKRACRILEVLEALNRGELAARTGLGGGDFLGQLGTQLDLLLQGLELELRGLAHERDLLNGILSGMEEGVLLVDGTGRVSRINPALKAMLPFLPDPIGRPLLEAVRHEELKQLLDEVQRSGQVGSKELELAGLYQSGRYPRRLLVRASPGSMLPLQAGTLGLLAVFIDVTQLRRLETLRREFVANVSHELRTPVTAIRSASETLREGAARDPEALPLFLEMIERNSARLHALIEDLLELSRIESRELALELVPLEVSRAFVRVEELFEERARKRGVTLSWEVQSEPLFVLADERALEQILTNLVDNALKYCPSGRVTLRGGRSDRWGVLEVQDTGPGIEARHLPRLFERFFRVDPGRSREQGGTGLGLAIVKHLAEVMSGEVEVRSEVGSGSTFIVRLPVCVDDALEDEIFLNL